MFGENIMPMRENELTRTLATTTFFLPITSPSLTKNTEPMRKPARRVDPSNPI